MIQCQGTSACFVGATPRVSVDPTGRLDPLPRRSKLGTLQNRGVGPTQGVLTCFACAFVPDLPEVCAKHNWDKLLWRRMWVPYFCRCWEHLALITAKGSECLSNRHARGMVLQGLTLHLYTEKLFSHAQEQPD